MRDEVRTAVSVGEKRPEGPERARVTDPKKIEQSILMFLQATYDFIRADKIPDYHPNQFEETGLLWRTFLLSELREFLGYPAKGESNDTLILEALDRLAKKGKVKIFRLLLNRDLEVHDIKIWSEIGTAIRSYKSSPGKTIPWVLSIRLYSNEPLRKKEHDEHSIFNPKERIEAIRKERDAHFAKIFGESGLEVESRLHREDVEDELRLKKAVMEIADCIKTKEKK